MPPWIGASSQEYIVWPNWWDERHVSSGGRCCRKADMLDHWRQSVQRPACLKWFGSLHAAESHVWSKHMWPKGK